MPYPSPITYPSPTLYPKFETGSDGQLVAVGDGPVLGATDAFGVRWSLVKFDGWKGSPSPTLQLQQRARGHGATASESFLTPRIMTLEGFLHTHDCVQQDEALDRLNAAVTLEPFELLVSEPSGLRHITVQRQGEVIPTVHTPMLAGYSILVSAKDPRKFGELITDSTTLASSTGGLMYPVTYPVTYTGFSNSGVIRVLNTGNTQAPVWLRIDGPIPAGGWTVTHIGKKQSLTFSTSLGLAAGEFVTVDMDRREVLAQGQSARAGYVTSRGWFSLDPGVNDIAFSAQNYSATAQLTVTTKPAWL